MDGKVYGSTEEMIQGVSEETGVAAGDVKKVLDASRASTTDFILQQLGGSRRRRRGR